MTQRETEVFELMKKGLRNAEIAQKLGIAQNTVKIHVKKVLAHHKAKDRHDLFFKKKIKLT